jgi:hypothetical protein
VQVWVEIDQVAKGLNEKRPSSAGLAGRVFSNRNMRLKLSGSERVNFSRNKRIGHHAQESTA